MYILGAIIYILGADVYILGAIIYILDADRTSRSQKWFHYSRFHLPILR